MPDTLTPVTQHLAVWDLQRDAGWVALYGEGSRPLTWTAIEDSGAISSAIVSMLSDRRGLCFDAQDAVVRRHRGAGAGRSRRGRRVRLTARDSASPLRASHALDRVAPWHRLPRSLGLVSLMGIRIELRAHNLYDPAPAARRRRPLPPPAAPGGRSAATSRCGRCALARPGGARSRRAPA